MSWKCNLLVYGKVMVLCLSCRVGEGNFRRYESREKVKWMGGWIVLWKMDGLVVVICDLEMCGKKDVMRRGMIRRF